MPRQVIIGVNHFGILKEGMDMPRQVIIGVSDKPERAIPQGTHTVQNNLSS